MDNSARQADTRTESPELTVFTVNIDGEVYRCVVGPAALYLLASMSTAKRDQVDAYLELKSCVHNAVARIVRAGRPLPAVMMPEHFMIRETYADCGYAETGYTQ